MTGRIQSYSFREKWKRISVEVYTDSTLPIFTFVRPENQFQFKKQTSRFFETFSLLQVKPSAWNFDRKKKQVELKKFEFGYWSMSKLSALSWNSDTARFHCVGENHWLIQEKRNISRKLQSEILKEKIKSLILEKQEFEKSHDSKPKKLSANLDFRDSIAVEKLIVSRTHISGKNEFFGLESWWKM